MIYQTTVHHLHAEVSIWSTHQRTSTNISSSPSLEANRIPGLIRCSVGPGLSVNRTVSFEEDGNGEMYSFNL